MSIRHDEAISPLQAGLDQAIALQTAPEKVLALMVATKLREQRVRLTKKEREALREAAAEALKTNDASAFARAIRRKRPINVRITARDFRSIEKVVTQAVTETINSTTVKFARSAEPQLRRWTVQERERLTADTRGFRERLAQSWKRPFELYAQFRLLAVSTGIQAIQHLQKQNTLQSSRLATALAMLHARACLVAAEVEALIKAGYADGAEARWRTLHEIAVTAAFLVEHGEPTAEQYLDHEACEDLRGARMYEQHRRKLGYRTLGRRELQRLQAKVDALKQKHGVPFGEQYGWAAAALNNRQPNFAEIEKAVKLMFMRPYYKLASEQVHASSRGARRRTGVGNLQEPAQLLIGPSNYGFADAAMNSAHALLIATACLASRAPTVDSNVAMMVLGNWEVTLRQSFVRAQAKIEERQHRLDVRRSHQGT